MKDRARSHGLSLLLAELYATTERWHEQANCRGMDINVFFPERHASKTGALAKEVCRGCAVRQECLDYATRVPERFGIFGGLSVKERRRRVRGQRQGGAA